MEEKAKQDAIFRHTSPWESILGDHKFALDAVRNAGWSNPSSVQGEALPKILNPLDDGTFHNVKVRFGGHMIDRTLISSSFLSVR
jgi:hypothetical protein